VNHLWRGVMMEFRLATYLATMLRKQFAERTISWCGRCECL